MEYSSVRFLQFSCTYKVDNTLCRMTVQRDSKLMPDTDSLLRCGITGSPRNIIVSCIPMFIFFYRLPSNYPIGLHLPLPS